MSSSVVGWFRLTSTLPWASGWLRASLMWASLGSLSSSSAVDSLTWTMESSSPELRSMTSAQAGESTQTLAYKNLNLETIKTRYKYIFFGGGGEIANWRSY